MTEVMDRAARRRAQREAGKLPFKVEVSNRVAVVPLEHIESYYAHEIASEGKWASDRRLIVIRPKEDRGMVDRDWFSTIVERMHETRRRKGTIPLTMREAGEMNVDVGLVDVTVSFEMPPGTPPSLPTTQAEWDRILMENFRHFDSVCAGALHDQMIVATVFHTLRNDGSRLLHYHNLIFGLRQQVRDDMDILGPLDLEPLMKALSKSGPISVIGGRKH